MAKVLLATLYKRQRNYQVGPPLGVMYLAAALRRAGHEPRIMDLRARQESLSLETDQITHFVPDVVGFSTVIPEATLLTEAVRLTKQKFPYARVAVGGPYANSSTLEVLKIQAVDAVVRGEGEHVLPRLVEAWGRGEEHPELPGVGYPGITLGEVPAPIEDLDALPWPAWDLVNFSLYHRRPRHGYLYKYQEYFSVLSTRGCPYHCIFCQNIFGKQYRTRSARSVADEVTELVQKHGIREIHFVDDAFNLDLDRAKQICDLIVERGLKIAITFPAGLRADRMDRELIDKLAAAGAYKIPYGIETASPRLQRDLKKNVNLGKLKTIIEYTASRKIIAQGFFMVGFPTENESEIKETTIFALRSKLHFITFNHVNVFPGTELWTIAAELGKLKDYDPANCDYDNPPVHLSDVPVGRIKALVRNVHLRFYLNPRRLWRIWRVLPRKKHFFGFIGLFLGKLFWFSDRGRE